MTETQREPDIIDNIQSNMADILNLKIPGIGRLDVSSGYFELSGYGLVRDALEAAASGDGFALRVLLGMDAITTPSMDTFEEYRERSQKEAPQEDLSLGDSLSAQELGREGMDMVAGLIALLRRPNVQIRHNDRRFNHSKCYIMGDKYATVGSSNFTRSGFLGNHELNAGVFQPAALEKLDAWFERMWEKSKDAKAQIIGMLESSKFGIPATPYQVYLKMLFERYRRELAVLEYRDGADAAHLAGFQRDAVASALQIMGTHNGVIIADSTGLGKTHIGLEIMRRKALEEHRRILVIAPRQVLDTVWAAADEESGVKFKTLSAEIMGQKQFAGQLPKYRGFDMVVIDESHNFRSKTARRRENLMKLVTSGKRKQVVLLSATPINNSIMDLYYQASVITRGDDAHFADIGIPDLYSYMNRLANRGVRSGLARMEMLLGEIMIRRTRSFIIETYSGEDVKLAGKPIRFPDRDYGSIKYDTVEPGGTDVYSRLMETMSNLHMVPYGAETYNATLSQEERDKARARAHLQTVLLLKRFESSTAAAEISIANKIRMYERFGAMLEAGRVISVTELNRAISEWVRKSEEGETGTDVDGYVMGRIDRMPTEPASKYDAERMKKDMAEDLALLREYGKLLEKVKRFDSKSDAVAQKILADGALEEGGGMGGKVLIFTEYADTARHVRDYMRSKFPEKRIEMITGDVDPGERSGIIGRFAPGANPVPDGTAPGEGIDMLVSTEVLSEGQNLQDCNYVINYDLPWNPMRIVQRMGRIDRLTSRYGTVHSRDCYPTDKLEEVLRLVAKLTAKITTIDDAMGIDTALMGIEGNEKVINGIAGGGEGASKAIDELERASDLMPATTPFSDISRHIKSVGIEEMKRVPMGRRSGKRGAGACAILGYVRDVPTRRFYAVKFDYRTGRAAMLEDIDTFAELKCPADEGAFLPMDEGDSSASFAHLLRIDQLARQAVRDRLSSYVAGAAGRKGAHSGRVERALGIMMEAEEAGGITAEAYERAYRILENPSLKHWDREVASLLEDYGRDGDAAALAEGISKIAARAHWEPEDEGDAAEPEDPDLMLVGAMFITDGSSAGGGLGRLFQDG